MNYKWLGKLLMLLVLFLVGTMLFAAGKQEAAKKAKELTIYWNPNHNYKIYNKVMDKFAAEYGFKINKQLFNWPEFKTKIRADFAAGTAPDLIEAPPTWFIEFTREGLLYDMTADIKSWPDHKDWLEPSWNAVRYKGKFTGIPLHYTCFALFYNRSLFKKAGLDPDKPPATMKDFQEYIKKIYSTLGPEVTPYAFNPDGQFLLPFLVNGETQDMVKDGKSALGTPAIRKTLKILQKIARSGQVITPSPGAQLGIAQAKLFLGEKIAMYMSGPWDVINIMNNKPDLDYGVAMPPHVSGVEPKTLVAGTGMAIPKQTKYAKEVWELIKMLTSVETEVAATLEAGMLMPRKSWLSDPRIANVRTVKDFAPLLPNAVGFDASVGKVGVPEITWTGSVYRKLYQTMIYSDKDMDKALDEYIKEANRLIARKK